MQRVYGSTVPSFQAGPVLTLSLGERPKVQDSVEVQRARRRLPRGQAGKRVPFSSWREHDLSPGL